MHFITLIALLLLLSPAIANPYPRSGWVEQAPIRRGPRQEESATAVGTDLYIIGGIPAEPPYPTLDRVEVFSTITHSWRDVAPLPITLNHGNVATVNGKIYILGGLNGTTDWLPLPNSYEYDPTTNTWSTLPSMPQDHARGAAAVGVHGSTIYIAGGLRELNLLTAAQPTVVTVTSYNTLTRQWTVLPPLPEGRDHVGGAVIGNTFYVVGGRIDGIPNGRDTVFAMDVTAKNKTWVQKARMPTARGGLAVAAVGERIFTFGGEGDRTVVPNGVFDSVEVYDVARDKWEVLPPMPIPRHGTGAAAIGCAVHVPGGGNVTGAGAQSRNDYFWDGGCVGR